MEVIVGQLGTPVDLRPLLRTVRARLDDLVASLDGDEWRRATVCPGWDVADLVAHLVGDDLGRLSRTHDGARGPERRPGEDLPRFLDRINDEWVVACRRLSPAVLASLLGAGAVEVTAMWDAMALDDVTDGVSWAGLADGPMWMDLARDTTEYWIHEQQLREAVGRLHHDPTEASIVVDALARGLPHALRGVPAPDGAVVVVHAVDLDTAWLLARRGDRWWFDGPADSQAIAGAVPALATVSADAAGLWRRWSRHPDGPPEALVRSGDRHAAAAVVDHLAIIRTRD